MGCQAELPIVKRRVAMLNECFQTQEITGGLGHLFAADYQRQFGELPKATLLSNYSK